MPIPKSVHNTQQLTQTLHASNFTTHASNLSFLSTVEAQILEKANAE